MRRLWGRGSCLALGHHDGVVNRHHSSAMVVCGVVSDQAVAVTVGEKLL